LNYMLTNNDIKRIISAQIEAQREIFYTKDDLDKKFSNLQTSVDAFALDKKTTGDEIPVLNSRIKNGEDWIDKASLKIGLKFKH
jgi:hypothetical protein